MNLPCLFEFVGLLSKKRERNGKDCSPSSFLLLLVRHLFLEAMHLFLEASRSEETNRNDVTTSH